MRVSAPTTISSLPPRMISLGSSSPAHLKGLPCLRAASINNGSRQSTVSQGTYSVALWGIGPAPFERLDNVVQDFHSVCPIFAAASKCSYGPNFASGQAYYAVK